MREMLEEGALILEVTSQNMLFSVTIRKSIMKNSPKRVSFLHAGVPFVASHPDMVCPSPDGGLPDVGAYLALLKTTTGVDPVHITGKPNAGMILHKIEDLGLDPARCAMVGDRLYTDLAMATRAGCVGVLVLSGEATMDDVLELEVGAEQQPTVIVQSVDELLR